MAASGNGGRDKAAQTSTTNTKIKVRKSKR